MSASVLDRARAFALIADTLSEEKRTEVAELLADKLIAESGGKRRTASADPAPVEEPPPDQGVHDEAARFLEANGYRGARLVQAAGRLAEYLKFHQELTRAAGMRGWLRRELMS